MAATKAWSSGVVITRGGRPFLHIAGLGFAASAWVWLWLEVSSPIVQHAEL